MRAVINVIFQLFGSINSNPFRGGGVPRSGLYPGGKGGLFWSLVLSSSWSFLGGGVYPGQACSQGEGRGTARKWYTSWTGQGIPSSNRLRHGRYTSCDHAGGLSCLLQVDENILATVRQKLYGKKLYGFNDPYQQQFFTLISCSENKFMLCSHSSIPITTSLPVYDISNQWFLQLF